MSLDKYAHLNKCKIWRRNWNKRKYVPRIQLSFSKNEHQNEVVWLIHLKGAIKYQCSDFPRHATLDEEGEQVFGSADLALKSARIVDLCGKSSGFADFEDPVDRGSAVIFHVDSGLCLSYVGILSPK